MVTPSVPLPIQFDQTLIYLLCADCGQRHYFRAVKFPRRIPSPLQPP